MKAAYVSWEHNTDVADLFFFRPDALPDPNPNLSTESGHKVAHRYKNFANHLGDIHSKHEREISNSVLTFQPLLTECVLIKGQITCENFEKELRHEGTYFICVTYFPVMISPQ